MRTKFQVQAKIRKPLAEVFEAVVNPTKLTGCSIQSSTGPLVQSTTVRWRFAEAPEPFDVVVGEVVKNERTRVEMGFKPFDQASTMVQISESGWPLEKEGIQMPCDNAGGWMHMMCCLKRSAKGCDLPAGGGRRQHGNQR